MNEVRNVGNKNPLFLQFINKEQGVNDILLRWSGSKDERLATAAKNLLQEPPDLSEFRDEMEEAVRDLIGDGLGEEFKAFVNHYMEESLEEELEVSDSRFGENRTQIARIKDEQGPWVQGILCYNLCLYIKAFGLENLKSCRVCQKLFAHKGKWAVYCSDQCKKNKDQKKPDQQQPQPQPQRRVLPNGSRLSGRSA